MKNQLTCVAILAFSTLLVGCENNNVGISDSFGNAVRQNMAAHIINPEPILDTQTVPDTDGARAAAAAERYRSGDTTEVEEITTSNTGSGGGRNR